MVVSKLKNIYLQYKSLKRWLLSWIQFIFIIQHCGNCIAHQKKLEILTLTKIDFSEEKCQKKRLKDFSSGGACPQTPLAAQAFSARDLPRLVLKPGYGPGNVSKT